MSKPTVSDTAKQAKERRAQRQLTDEDWRVWGEQDPLNKEYLRRLDIASMTDAERAAIGLSGDDWALKMWEGLDRASIKFPTPGFAERHAGKDE